MSQSWPALGAESASANHNLEEQTEHTPANQNSDFKRSFHVHVQPEWLAHSHLSVPSTFATRSQSADIIGQKVQKPKKSHVYLNLNLSGP